jgi:hypothetical protein
MNYELAEEIAHLAAPIYAALLQRAYPADLDSKDWHRAVRAAAIRQAFALWQETLKTEA